MTGTELQQEVGRILNANCTLDKDTEGHNVIYTNVWYIDGQELEQIQDVCHILTISVEGGKLTLTVEDLNR